LLPSFRTATDMSSTQTCHSSGPHCWTIVPGSHGHLARSLRSSSLVRGKRTMTAMSSVNTGPSPDMIGPMVLISLQIGA
jgi:hypothetical protein